MRISTNIIFESSTSSLNRQTNAFMKVGKQIASGKRVVNPSDDPLATSKASAIAQSAAVNKQFTDSRVSARNSLSQAESVLNSVTDGITSIKTLLVQAASGTLTDADRESIASEIEGIYQTLIGQANSADGNGRYLFGGYKDKSPPFVQSGAGVVSYVGDTGIMTQQVDSARWMPTTNNGINIFQSTTGSTSMVARVADTNTGSLRVSTPVMSDSSNPNFRAPFDVVFSDVAGVSYYSVDGGAPVAYTEGDEISYNGYSVTLEGAPQAGDTVRVAAGADGNQDMFKSIKDAIDVLTSPATTDAEKAKLDNVLRTVSNELSNSMDNVLTVRASLGARLNELDSIDMVSTNRDLNYTESLSDLMDLDYNEALSEYSLKQIGLQAAQKSFVDIQQLSLFNYLK